MATWVSSILVILAVACTLAAPAVAQCISRGVWTKYTYCFGGDSRGAGLVDPGPTEAERFAALITTAEQKRLIGDYAGAIVELESALSMRPNDARARQVLQWARDSQEAALKDQERSQREFEAQRLADQAHMMINAGHLDRAWQLAAQAAKITPNLEYVVSLHRRLHSIERNTESQKRTTATEAVSRDQAAADAANLRALANLSQRFAGPAWSDAMTAYTRAQSARRAGQADGGSFGARVPFDTLDGLIGSDAPSAPGTVAAGRAIPIPSIPLRVVGAQLLEKIEVIEQREHDVVEELKRNIAAIERERLQRQRVLLAGAKAVAEIKLISLTIDAPR